MFNVNAMWSHVLSPPLSSALIGPQSGHLSGQPASASLLLLRDGDLKFPGAFSAACGGSLRPSPNFISPLKILYPQISNKKKFKNERTKHFPAQLLIKPETRDEPGTSETASPTSRRGVHTHFTRPVAAPSGSRARLPAESHPPDRPEMEGASRQRRENGNSGT